MALRRIRVALFGGGVVGGGVASILHQRSELFARNGLQFCLKYLVVRDVKKPRDFDIPSTAVVTDSHEEVLADDDVDMIVEVMGGEAASPVIFGSARRGKHVVTANKAFLAAHLPEIIEAFPADRRSRLGFEASVAGGIPIIRAAQQSLAPDSVQCIAGILNGTTNYMLTQGFAKAGSYEGALALAQVDTS
jgi:homoserine dehydrogenase